MRHSKKKRQLIKQKQQRYVNHWNIGQNMKYYDALDDKYATYYFANPAVKKHFKHFQKIVKKQPKTVDLLRMTFLLENKYKKKSRVVDGSANFRQEESLNDSLVKSYEPSLKPQSLQKLRKVNKYQLQPEQSQKQKNKINRAESLQDKLPKVKNTKIYKSRNQQGELLPPSKKAFVEYLQKKKQQIQKN